MRANLIRVAKRIARHVIGRPIMGRSILAYHRIAKADFDPWNIAVAPEEFERQLIRLRRKTVLPLQQFLKLRYQNRLPRNAVAITFDDGYACNALAAAPMLESFGYPATFFVVSDAISRSEEFWWDQLEYIYRNPSFDYRIAARLLDSRSVDRLRRKDGPSSGFLVLWSRLRELRPEDRRQHLQDFRDRLGIGEKVRPSHRPMTTTELRTLAANPLFEIGGHTATHALLPTLSPAEQEQEIVSGTRSLEAIIGKPIRSFSYPFGEWTPATRDIVRMAGFACAVTAAHRRVRPNDNDLELPRRQVVNQNAHTP